MGIDFDTYLVDEITSVGDAAFRAKSQQVFTSRMKKSSSVVVSHSMPFIRQTCSTGAVLHHGKLKFFDKIDEAIAFYEQMSFAKAL